MVLSSERARTVPRSDSQAESKDREPGANFKQLRELGDCFTHDLAKLREGLTSKGEQATHDDIAEKSFDPVVAGFKSEFEGLAKRSAITSEPSAPPDDRAIELKEKVLRFVRDFEIFRDYPNLRNEAVDLVERRTWPSSPREGQEIDLVRYLVDITDKQHQRGDIDAVAVLSHGLRAQIDAIETGFRPYVSVGAAAIALAAGHSRVLTTW